MRTALIFVFVLLTGCSYQIVRNYPVPYEQQQSFNDPKIVKGKNLAGLNAKYLGSIKLDDLGFTINCSEYNALIVLKSEAKKINSNLVNITDESYPGASTCYRCTADFYSISNNKLTNEIIEKPQREIIRYDTNSVLKWDYFNTVDTLNVPYIFVSNIEVLSTGTSFLTGAYKRFRTRGVLYSDLSAINSANKNDSTLQHIQILYDLTQLHAKKLEQLVNLTSVYIPQMIRVLIIKE